MDLFRSMRGSVYILENPEAQRVKMGMTTNAVELRLREVNDMWLGRRGTCQICGGRLVLSAAKFPPMSRAASVVPVNGRLPSRRTRLSPSGTLQA